MNQGQEELAEWQTVDMFLSFFDKGETKFEVNPYKPWNRTLHPFSASTLDEGEWLVSRSYRF